MSARCQSVEILRQILENKIFFSALKNEKTSAFENMLVLTSLRHLVAIEDILSRYLKHKIARKDIVLKYILLCGVAEILYMSTPDYAAVSEYVQIAKKTCSKFAAGMVNAVLRKIAVEKPISTKIFPPTFVKILVQDYTPEQIKKMESVAFLEPPLDLSLQQNHGLWTQKLNGILFENGTLRIKNPGNIESLDGFSEGQWWVQDLASALPVCLLGNLKGLKVLEMCAAPGGKTAQLLSLGAHVTAVDISPERMARLEQNIKRLNLHQNLRTEVSDGLDYLDQTDEIFDLVVLDAPCSATGTFRRHPEVMHIKTQADVIAQARLARVLLEKSAKCVAPQGRLLFCTCSLARAEGEEQINAFLEKNSTFKFCSFTRASFLKDQNTHLLEKNIFDKQVLRTLPYDEENLGGMDGFFAACLQRS